jgi:hypothetical protein
MIYLLREKQKANYTLRRVAYSKNKAFGDLVLNIKESCSMIEADQSEITTETLTLLDDFGSNSLWIIEFERLLYDYQFTFIYHSILNNNLIRIIRRTANMNLTREPNILEYIEICLAEIRHEYNKLLP